MITTVLFVVLGQAATEDWWDTPTGQMAGNILSIFVAVAAIAGGVKGVQYLLRETRDAHMWGLGRYRERQRRDDLLDQILSREGWPNGAESIVEAHQDLYEKAVSIEGKVDELARAVERVITDR